MHPLFIVLMYPIYLSIRFIIHTIRDIMWIINGTRSKILKRQTTEHYSSCGQLMTIVGRFKLDEVLACNTLRDFILLHEKFVQPDYVLAEEVTLYHVDGRHAVFVEAASGVCAWDITSYCFSRSAQFHTARRVIILPITAAHTLASQLGKPKGKMIFLSNTSRCGSTLFCQMFQKTNRFVTYSEPSVLTDLTKFSNCEVYPWIARHMVTVVSLLCKPSSLVKENQQLGHVVKLMALNTEIVQSLEILFPEAIHLFMYRDYIPTAVSLAKLYLSQSYVVLFALVSMISEKLQERMDINLLHIHPRGVYFRVAPGRGLYYSTSLVLISNLVYYRSLRERSFNISAVRYEDIVNHPQHSLNKIFQYCGLDDSLVAPALTALEYDSQANSTLSRDKLAKVKAPEFTDKDRREICQLCDELNIGDVLAANYQPGTITMK